MEKSLSWEDDTSAATPEIPGILWNTIHFNIILPSTPRSSKRPHSHGGPHKTLYVYIEKDTN